ncbi:hypothetical protein [Occultella kanbiaonis]|uniref:hypothetical protein n=1 Tax=Occultella kanbiaonis TaxID=2675754 RepID=UPI0012BA1797|nr:hypothetical protein [Occultella kanbiaonis]
MTTSPLATTWAPAGVDAKYALHGGGPVSSAPTELNTVASPAEGANAEGTWTARNPLVWFGAIAAVTFGLMAFSTSVRVGGTTATLALGNAKG